MKTDSGMDHCFTIYWSSENRNAIFLVKVSILHAFFPQFWDWKIRMFFQNIPPFAFIFLHYSLSREGGLTPPPPPRAHPTTHCAAGSNAACRTETQRQDGWCVRRYFLFFFYPPLPVTGMKRYKRSTHGSQHNQPSARWTRIREHRLSPDGWVCLPLKICCMTPISHGKQFVE